MLKRSASAEFLSTLTLATLALPICSEAISSSTGPSILHGPHHSAQKSTTTGCVEFKTSASKFDSLTSMVGIICNSVPYTIVISNVTYSHKKMGRQLALFDASRHVSRAARTTSARVVFRKSCSSAFSADSNTFSSVLRMQFPTGQPALGFFEGDLK